MVQTKIKKFSLVAILCGFLLIGCQSITADQGVSAEDPADQHSVVEGGPVSLPVTGNDAGTGSTGQVGLAHVLPTDEVGTDQVGDSGGSAEREPGESAAAVPITAPAVNTATSAPTQTLVSLSEEQWKDWPITPQVPEELKAVYQRGLAQGNDPHAFSILGDCQSQPDVFMGIFDSDPRYVQALSPVLQDAVANFSGSFNRYSPTVKDATTEGALLWAQWNDNKEKKCNAGETPIDCELRVHKPSFVFLHVGTHWEARNRHYQELILEKILTHGAVPILVTKADNREKDERVNKNLASLAVQYHLPLWNFWASVQHLPDNGLKPGSDMYLNDEAMAIHRMGALQALDVVWRGVQE